MPDTLPKRSELSCNDVFTYDWILPEKTVDNYPIKKGIDFSAKDSFFLVI